MRFSSKAAIPLAVGSAIPLAVGFEAVFMLLYGQL